MDAFVRGKQARADGKPLKANPYKDGTSDHTVWRAGWRSPDIILKLNARDEARRAA